MVKDIDWLKAKIEEQKQEIFTSTAYSECKRDTYDEVLRLINQISRFTYREFTEEVPAPSAPVVNNVPDYIEDYILKEKLNNHTLYYAVEVAPRNVHRWIQQDKDELFARYWLACDATLLKKES